MAIEFWERSFDEPRTIFVVGKKDDYEACMRLHDAAVGAGIDHFDVAAEENIDHFMGVTIINVANKYAQAFREALEK